MKLCLKCGLERESGRRLCRECYLQHKRQQANERYKREGRRHYSCTCLGCESIFSACRSTAKFCPTCRKTQAGTKANYANGKGGGYCWMHRKIAEKILNRKLTFNEVVHHIDCDGQNNSLENLIVMSRSDHRKFHSLLTEQKTIFDNTKNNLPVNDWKTILKSLTNSWIQQLNIKTELLNIL